MNIWFDANNAQAQSAASAFSFDDLDLIGDSDPVGLFESISFSYWDGGGSNFDRNQVGNTITMAVPTPVTGVPFVAMSNLVMLSLGGDTAVLDALNRSSEAKGGFWIQLGFGLKHGWKGQNTVEYLAAELRVSPVPTAFWVF
jgi:hypothetical protein